MSNDACSDWSPCNNTNNSQYVSAWQTTAAVTYVQVACCLRTFYCPLHRACSVRERGYLHMSHVFVDLPTCRANNADEGRGGGRAQWHYVSSWFSSRKKVVGAGTSMLLHTSHRCLHCIHAYSSQLLHAKHVYPVYVFPLLLLVIVRISTSCWLYKSATQTVTNITKYSVNIYIYIIYMPTQTRPTIEVSFFHENASEGSDPM